MHRPYLFIAQTIIIAVVAAIHLAALQWSLYWRYIWLDTPVHFLAGLWVALATTWLITYTGRYAPFVRIIMCVMVVGIGWEVFEFLAGIPRKSNYALDTSIDLFMDLCGGTVGYILARQFRSRDTMIGNESS